MNKKSDLYKKYSEIMNTCKQKRESTKWKLSKMSKVLNISKTTLWNYENLIVIDFFFLESYAKIFNIDLVLLTNI